QVVTDRIVGTGLADKFLLHSADLSVSGCVRFPQDLFAHGEVEPLVCVFGGDPLLGFVAGTADVGQGSGEIAADIDLPVRIGDFVQQLTPRYRYDVVRPHAVASRPLAVQAVGHA